ncbi:MAG: M48 family metallopeptidase [Burkholderiaceae bacterium]
MAGKSRKAGGPQPVRNAQELRQRTQAWALKLRVNPRVIRIQEMRSKWGSCSSLGTVTLAYDLIQQAESFQDYVIVHELLHLRVPNHGRVFKALLTAYVPGWHFIKEKAKIFNNDHSY